MRISFFIFTICLLHLSATVYSQNELFVIETKNTTMRELFHEIERQSHFRFFYNDVLVNIDMEVSINVKDKRIDEVLDMILAGTDITYRILENQLIVVSPVSLLRQQLTVTGVVTDAEGEPIPGVNVVIKGTMQGTVTDANGVYSISVPDDNAVLVFSFVGYATQEFLVGDQRAINVILSEDTRQIEEVVVIGYGTMRKKDLTGSIVQIRPDKIVDENPKTVQDILRGTPGLRVSYDPSAKGGGTILIRGQNSVYTAGGHNEPLIILDGMMFMGELSEINPDDIGQIDVLKDASSAAIYGAKAASGVIIITTKKGKLGKPIVNVNANIGFTTKAIYRERYSPEGYLKFFEDYYKTTTYGTNPTTGKYEEYQAGGLPPGYYDHPRNLSQYGVSLDDWRAYTTNAPNESDASIYARRLFLQESVLENYLAGKTFDWYKHSFQTGLNQDYNASVSGANDKMNYYLSFGYLNNNGAMKGNEYEAVRSNMKVEGKVNKWLEIGANVNFQSRNSGDISREKLGALGGTSSDEIDNSPYSMYRDDDGNLTMYPMMPVARRGRNFDFMRQYLELENGYTVFNSILFAKVKLPFGITYSFNASPRYQFYYNRYHESAEHPEWSITPNGVVDRDQSKRFDWSLNNTIHWEHTFAQKHYVNLTLVQEAEERRYWADAISARNILPSDALGFHNTQNGDNSVSTFSSNDSRQTADALLARLFYSYNNRYMLTASVRRDGYCAFGQNNPYATFPSVAVAWSFVDEDFFQWQPMSVGKLRVSWGKNGNRALEDPYISLANLAMTTMQGYLDASNNLYKVYGMYLDRMANPNLQWEKTTAMNFGLDFGFFDNRISGNIEYYVMNTHDMIMLQRLPSFTGFSTITTNLGEVSNKGVELYISSLNIKNNLLEWRTSLNFSYNKNKIKHLYYENEDILDSNGNVTTKEMDDRSRGWFIGKPIDVIWNYRVTGIWQVDEIEEAKIYGNKPGDTKVANNYTGDDRVNADGSVTPVYNDRDKEFLGQTTPPVMWSLRNDFTFFKSLDVSFNIYSYMGHKSLSGDYRNAVGSTAILYNFNQSVRTYWTPENPTNKYGRLESDGPQGLGGQDKAYDRSFIRLENISIGYTLPGQWAQKIDAEKIKLYGSIRNVAVWNNKNWVHWDPETGGLATRVFSIGLNVTF